MRSKMCTFLSMALVCVFLPSLLKGVQASDNANVDDIRSSIGVPELSAVNDRDLQKVEKKEKAAKKKKSPKQKHGSKTTQKTNKTKSSKKTKGSKKKKSPKKTKSPKSPSKPFGAITEAGNCQLYRSWELILKGSFCSDDAKNSIDCFSGFGENNNEVIERLCPAIPRRKLEMGRCVSFLEGPQFEKRAEKHCAEALKLDLEQYSLYCDEARPNRKCECYNACKKFQTEVSGYASNGGTCCQNLCPEPVTTTTTTTTTPPPTTAR